ncbi:uncharacterized protein [Nicotiana tomentosiformis]|uniref:uncharacterized protein n=1 Tax=Nicotiana tomentosiformis TaxID=4098 RepID=UPI00388CDD91
MRQIRWVELLKDYDIDILYHEGKANIVEDALSRISIGSLGHLEEYQRPLVKEVHRLASLGVHLADSSERGVIVQNRAESSLVVDVKGKQYNDPLLVQLKEGIHKHMTIAFTLGMDDGTLRQVLKLRNKEIASVKVLWQKKQVEEATWEAEEEMKKKYPHLFE